MRDAMLVVEHADHDAEETANLGHNFVNGLTGRRLSRGPEASVLADAAVGSSRGLGRASRPDLRLPAAAAPLRRRFTAAQRRVSGAARFSRRRLDALVRPGRGPRFEPALERPLTFSGGLSGQETFDADVLIQVRPVNSHATPYEAPMIPVLTSAVEQPWVPGKRYHHGSTIHEVNGQRIIRHLDFLSPRNLHLSR